MKIRAGFVSNSSSSSFCVYGIETGSERLKDAGFVFSEDEDDLYDKLYEKCQEFGLDVTIHGDTGAIYIGLHPDSIDMDETKRQFQKRVLDSLNEFLPNGKFVAADLSTYSGEFYT